MATSPGKTRTPSALLQAIDADAYEWMSAHAPEYLAAIETEVALGVTPEEIKRFLLRHLGPERVGLALRCEQASRYLERMGER